MILYSQKIHLLLQPNSNGGLTMNAFNTDNYVDPAPNIMPLSDRTHTMHTHISNSTSIPYKPSKIPPIPHHTKPFMLSNAPLSNAKSCDTNKNHSTIDNI